MKIFICWSGDASHELAKILRNWLPVVLRGEVSAWVSSEDIGKGLRWSDEIAAELESSNFGIVCFLPDNLDNVWMHFEAGALSKSIIDGRVVPLLLGVEEKQVVGALKSFQMTNFDKEDIRKLIEASRSLARLPSGSPSHRGHRGATTTNARRTAEGD